MNHLGSVYLQTHRQRHKCWQKDMEGGTKFLNRYPCGPLTRLLFIAHYKHELCENKNVFSNGIIHCIFQMQSSTMFCLIDMLKICYLFAVLKTVHYFL